MPKLLRALLVVGTQISPRPCLAMKFTAAGVTTPPPSRVAFVLAVGVVGHDDHLPRTDVAERMSSMESK